MVRRAKKIRIMTIMSIVLIFIVLLIPSYAYASPIEDSKIFTGMQKLLDDIGKALIIIAIPVGIAVTTYCFIRRSAADEMDHKKWSNRISIAITSTVGAVVAGVIITVISNYFN